VEHGVTVLSKFFGIFSKSREKRVDLRKRFELLARTGQGSMSKVWRARDRNLGRIVCVKVLDKEKTAKFEERFKGLKRPSEGAVCLSMRHKNVVQTYEYGINTEGEPFLVMELIEGVGLNFLVETRSPNLEGKRIPYLLQIADGLEYVHQQGFLHRDMCPRNIMINQTGLVKLIDFGLAIPNRPEFTRAGNRTGTINYLAPELIKRLPTDHRVDLFALGVTTYEVFTGELPWEKTTSLQTLLSHMNSAGKNPRQIRPDLDPDIAEFLIKAVQRAPQDRFQSVADFRDALKRLAEKES
jgi:serine/threonine protein kinase